MIVLYGCFEDVSAAIDSFCLCSVLHAVCLAIEADHPFGGQSVVWDQRGTVVYCFSIH